MIDVHTINDISFHPVHGTFSTAASDGTFAFWDKEGRARLKGYPTVGGAITSTAFSGDGQLWAYAISYDWSKGAAFNTPQYPTVVKIHQLKDEDCKPKPKVMTSNSHR